MSDLKAQKRVTEISGRLTAALREVVHLRSANNSLRQNNKAMRDKLIDLRNRVKAYDDVLDGIEEKNWDDSRPPTGDDYNELYAAVMTTLIEVVGSC